MALKKIKLPDNSVVEVQDSRIPAPQSSDNGKVLGVTSAAGAMGWVNEGKKSITITLSPQEGTHELGELSVAATALGISNTELLNICNGEYDVVTISDGAWELQNSYLTVHSPNSGWGAEYHSENNSKITRIYFNYDYNSDDDEIVSYTYNVITDALSPKIYVGTCATAAATVNKVVSVEQFPMDGNRHPLVGTTIAFKSTYTNSATAPKLKVNSTDAASVWYNTSAVTNANSYMTQANVYSFYVWDGTYWVWINFGKELNDNTLAYQVRTNSSSRPAADAFVRYRLLFSSADNTKWVPANTSTNTTTTAAKTVNQRPIDPFGTIVYYNSTTAISAGSRPGITVQYIRTHGVSIGYSFNRTGAAPTLTSWRPVYLVCKPATDGSAIMDGDTPYAQALPTTEDGKIYIFLGVAYDANNMELYEKHPIYWYKDGAIRLYTNSNSNTQKEEDGNISGYLSRAIGSNEAWTETLATGTMAEGYIYGADGAIAATSDYWNYYTIPLGTAKKVRFNGFAPNEPPSSSDAWSSGYAFYDSNDNCVASANWAIDTSLPAHTEKEFIVDVPTGATILRVTNARDDAYYCYTKKRPFYCYLMEGKTISEMSVQAQEIAYANLKTMRDNARLEPGKKYRITDYVTTTTDTESRSLAHPFDIIVQALDASHLNEEALAAQHSGDTYFANTNFAAWKIWYCLDNDTTRFAWADTTNGKGVIYRMIDEFNNDVPYDFKNIQFKRYKVTAKTAYTVNSQSINLTASLGVCNGLYIGLSGTKSRGFDIDSSDYKWYFTFTKLGSTWSADIEDASLTGAGANNNTYGAVAYSGAVALNNIVNANGQVVTDFRLGVYSALSSSYYFTDLVAVNSHFGEGSRDIMHLGFCGNCFFESQYRNNIGVGTCQRHCSGGSDCQNNTIVTTGDCAFNAYASDFADNVVAIKNSFIQNTVGGGFKSNVIRTATTYNFANNGIGNSFHDNNIDFTTTTFGFNTIGSSFYNNNIGGYLSTSVFCGPITGNTINSQMQYCSVAMMMNSTLTGQIYGLEVDGSFNYIELNGPIKNCKFGGLLQYIVVPAGVSSSQFVACDVKGYIRGTSSAKVTLDASQFYLTTVSTTLRRITIEGQADGKITATWMDGGKRVGIYKTQGDATWTALPEAYYKPSTGIPETDLESGTQMVIQGAIQGPLDADIFDRNSDDELTIKNGGISKAKIASTDIDSTPTASSTNLVTSGGVAAAISNKGVDATDTSSKIFLVGATAQVTDAQTYSDNEIYATNGVLTTKSVQVGGTSAAIQYNSTDKSIEFIFS